MIQLIKIYPEHFDALENTGNIIHILILGIRFSVHKYRGGINIDFSVKNMYELSYINVKKRPDLARFKRNDKDDDDIKWFKVIFTIG